VVGHDNIASKLEAQGNGKLYIAREIYASGQGNVNTFNKLDLGANSLKVARSSARQAPARSFLPTPFTSAMVSLLQDASSVKGQGAIEVARSLTSTNQNAANVGKLVQAQGAGALTATKGFVAGAGEEAVKSPFKVDGAAKYDMSH